MAPKVSVIIANYNNAKYLPDCLRSVATQSFSDFECIVVDDGSTDDSGILCDEFAKKDLRFTIIHINNQGVSHARNVGLKKAIGRLSFLVISQF